MVEWYPKEKKALNELIENLMINKDNSQKVHGLVVPHAGYDYSGETAGKAFSLIKEAKKAIIFGPSHYMPIEGIASLEKINTPLGKVKIIENKLEKIKYEHSIENQIPFLQKINPEIEILPVIVGEITKDEARKIADNFSKFEGILIFSTDLSHFLSYEEAIKKDKETIKAIETLNNTKLSNESACGIYPLIILIELCKIKRFKPHLIEYKTSFETTGDKNSVVGYASFWF